MGSTRFGACLIVVGLMKKRPNAEWNAFGNTDAIGMTGARPGVITRCMIGQVMGLMRLEHLLLVGQNPKSKNAKIDGAITVALMLLLAHG
jgi:hypothetical protein